MAIFEYEDCDGDSLEVLEDASDPDEDLTVWITPRYRSSSVNGSAGVRLPHDQVLSLRDRLTDWLGENTPAPMTPGDVRAMIAEAVMSLQHSPQAYVPEPDAEDGWTSSGLELCTRYECAKTREAHLDHDDPEPHDIGHSVAPVGDRRCADCSHGQRDHGDGFCWGDQGKSQEPACTCALFVPKEVIVPQCGVCKQPWSGGHGQSGNPCVKPVALPYCTTASGGCNHSWGQHTQGTCKARGMFGVKVTACGCTRVRGVQ